MTTPPAMTREQLARVFHESEKPKSQWRLGMEAERFCLRPDNSPLPYEGHPSLVALMGWLCEHKGWSAYRETESGPIIALTRGDSSLTLEPGAQLELSGAPHPTVHGVATEWRDHLAEIGEVERIFDVWFARVGFHPFSTRSDLPWVPKRRYPIMAEYLPTKGPRALDMMQRTATVQVNLDYASERDAMHKVVTLLRLTPLIQAMTLNSPLVEGKRGARLSERLDVWLNMDPSRSGLIPELWDLPNPSYQDYIAWAVKAGMFLVVRDGEIVTNTGQSFEDFNRDGFEGLRATPADWTLHLGTLFPEVRLKSTIEVRCCDALPPSLSLAVPALLAGIAYDDQSLDQATELSQRVSPAHAVELQRDVAHRGLEAQLAGKPIQQACLQLLEIAEGGLSRRDNLDQDGGSEMVYLEPLRALVEKGQTPAESLLAAIEANGSIRGALSAGC